jgi:hypothetical protein
MLTTADELVGVSSDTLLLARAFGLPVDLHERTHLFELTRADTAYDASGEHL